MGMLNQWALCILSGGVGSGIMAIILAALNRKWAKEDKKDEKMEVIIDCLSVLMVDRVRHGVTVGISRMLDENDPLGEEIRECNAFMREKGAADAADLQSRSPSMDGTAFYAEEEKIPDFVTAKATKNMLERKAGQQDGFVCKSSAGRVVRLIQAYDSDTFTDEPENLPAQWRFVWSTDPAKALPFVAMSTSPYATGDCCTENGQTWRSTIDNNVWAPSEYPKGWEVVNG